MTAVGRPWPAATLALTGWLCAAAFGAEPAVTDDPRSIFMARRDAFLQEGVRRADGFVFATVRVPVRKDAAGRQRDMADERAALVAAQRTIAWRLAEQIAPAVPDGGLRRAIGDAAARCAPGGFPLSGVLRVHAEAAAEAQVVVIAVPEPGLSAVEMDRAGLVDCLATRAVAGAVPPAEALVLEEVAPEPGGRSVPSSRLVDSLARTLGVGFSLSARGAWTSEGRCLVPGSLKGWIAPAVDAVRKSGSVGRALAPLAPEALASLSLDELLTLAAVRINDPAVLRDLESRLRTDGFARSADALRFPARDLSPFDDRPGKRLEREVRAKVFASPVVVALLLTDGILDVEWGPAPSCLAPATAAFDEGTPESVARSISMLGEGMGAVPNVDSVSLLAAALIASDEPGLAEPLARAAFTAMPSHKFAGVNALRAQRALDLKDRARELLPLVAAESQLGNWGRRQLESLAQWLGVPVPPVHPSKGAAGEGSPCAAPAPIP